MIISFFEEFPTKENLDKLKLITWPSKLYIAAQSVSEFQKIVRSVKNKNVQEVIYWPILQKKEGYWISPFTNRTALQRIFQELKNKKIPVMLDLELPTTQNPFLYITQCCNFWANKKLINDFIQNFKGDIYLAEYGLLGKKGRQFLQRWGLDYQDNKAKIIPMMYHSMHPMSEEKIREQFTAAKELFGKRCLLGLGAIAHGVTGTEPILPPENLQQDLRIAQEAGIQEVIIFRLGGLNEEYVKVIKIYH